MSSSDTRSYAHRASRLSALRRAFAFGVADGTESPDDLGFGLTWDGFICDACGHSAQEHADREWDGALAPCRQCTCEDFESVAGDLNERRKLTIEQGEGPRNLGYLGFVSELGFDAEGQLVWVGAWE